MPKLAGHQQVERQKSRDHPLPVLSSVRRPSARARATLVRGTTRTTDRRERRATRRTGEARRLVHARIDREPARCRRGAKVTPARRPPVRLRVPTVLAKSSTLRATRRSRACYESRALGRTPPREPAPERRRVATALTQLPILFCGPRPAAPEPHRGRHSRRARSDSQPPTASEAFRSPQADRRSPRGAHGNRVLLLRPLRVKSRRPFPSQRSPHP